jgi:stage II sporulation protein GA (sporulation sigma-E factor processing peptidase)
VVVYADMIFLLNASIDFLILWLTSGIRKQPTSVWKLLLSATIGGLYAVLYLWSAFSLLYFFPIKILVSLFMIWVAFGLQHPLSFFRNLGVFYLVCFLTGGAMIALHYFVTGDSQVAGGSLLSQSAKGWGTPVSWLLILLGFPAVWGYTRLSFRSLQERQLIHSYLTKVKITIGMKTIECTGLVDTGNQLRDPITRAPVMVIELKQIEKEIPPQLMQIVQQKDWQKGWMMLPVDWIRRIRVVPYRVSGNNGEMMIAFKPDQVEVLEDMKWNKVDKILIGIDVGRLSSDGSFQAIIHPSLLVSS